MTVQLDWAKIAGGLPEEHDANAAARVTARVIELHHWACLRLQMVPDISIVPPNVLVGLRKPFTDRCVTFFVNAQGNDMVLIGEGRKAPYVYLTDDAMTLAAEYLEPTKDTMMDTQRDIEMQLEELARMLAVEKAAKRAAQALAVLLTERNVELEKKLEGVQSWGRWMSELKLLDIHVASTLESYVEAHTGGNRWGADLADVLTNLKHGAERLENIMKFNRDAAKALTEAKASRERGREDKPGATLADTIAALQQAAEAFAWVPPWKVEEDS